MQGVKLTMKKMVMIFMKILNIFTKNAIHMAKQS